MTDLSEKFSSLQTQLTTQHRELMDVLSSLATSQQQQQTDLLNAVVIISNETVASRLRLDEIAGLLTTVRDDVALNRVATEDSRDKLTEIANTLDLLNTNQAANAQAELAKLTEIANTLDLLNTNQAGNAQLLISTIASTACPCGDQPAFEPGLSPPGETCESLEFDTGTVISRTLTAPGRIGIGSWRAGGDTMTITKNGEVDTILGPTQGDSWEMLAGDYTFAYFSNLAPAAGPLFATFCEEGGSGGSDRCQRSQAFVDGYLNVLRELGKVPQGVSLTATLLTGAFAAASPVGAPITVPSALVSALIAYWSGVASLFVTEVVETLAQADNRRLLVLALNSARSADGAKAAFNQVLYDKLLTPYYLFASTLPGTAWYNALVDPAYNWVISGYSASFCA